MRLQMPLLFGAALVIGVACGGSGSEDVTETPSNTGGAGSGKADQFGDASVEDSGADELAEDWTRDILSTDLSLDLAERKGTAVIRIAPSESTSASLEVKGLIVTDVRGADGPVRHVVRDGRLDVETPSSSSDEPIELQVEYGFSVHNDFDGYMSSGVTFLWPYFCSNLFPCKSVPDDGLRFTLAVAGVPSGKQAVFPTEIPSDAPSYMPAIAVGAYEHESLGTTEAGTKVGVWYLPGGRNSALIGTKYLAAAFDWFETTYGPYAFGKDVASVSASWGPGAYGGMEHHPYWHVGSGAMSDIETHVHEAGHGWYGNGVRIRCWEDFVLSEGTTTYITARALEAVADPTVAEEIWKGYRSALESSVASGDTPAWPQGCNEIDLLHHPLWSSIPYMKGAFFYKAVAAEVGVEVLDEVLAGFYEQHVGQAMHMQDMIDAIENDTGFDPAPLAEAWLKGMGIPE